MNRFLLTLLGTYLLLACNPDRIQYSDALKQEMRDKKVKRLTTAELTEAVDSWGEQLVALAQKEAAQTLAKKAPLAAVCSLQGLPKTQALAARYGLKISLLSVKDLTSKQLAPKEREVLDAYLYNAEKGLRQSSNVQRIGDTLYVYNAALPDTAALCRACFGTQKQPLAVWRLAFPKNEIIRHLKNKK